MLRGVGLGAEVARFAPIAWLRAVAAAPDGRSVAAGDATGAVHLFTLP